MKNIVKKFASVLTYKNYSKRAIGTLKTNKL